MELTEKDKLRIFDKLEDSFNNIIELICDSSGNILESSGLFTGNSEIIYDYISENSIEVMNMLLNHETFLSVNLRLPEASFFESFLCSSIFISRGIYILCIKQPTPVSKDIEQLTRQRNALHQKLLNSLNDFEQMFSEMYENCKHIYNFFNQIKSSFAELQTLTNREFEIFILLSRLPSIKKITEYLNVAESTAEKQIESIKSKTGLNSLSELSALSHEFCDISSDSDLQVSRLHGIVERNMKILQTVVAAESFAAPKEELTKRERMIVSLAAQQKSNKEIADILFISENTVKSHLTRIFKKLRVSSKADLTKKLKY